MFSAVEKEAAKAAKDAKFKAKKAKQAASSQEPSAKNKEKKAAKETTKEVALPEYIEETPAGDKKSRANTMLNRDLD